MKTTAVAPSNIAFIKYWGKKDEKLRLPENGSISMCLSDLFTTTTAEFDRTLKQDHICIDHKQIPEEANRVIQHLNRIRKLAGQTTYARVESINNFPKSAGLSSSASGFAALTLAATKALGLDLSEKELSILARQGAGSACRSIPDGFVEWFDGNSSYTSYSMQIYPPDYWDIVDIVAIVSEEKKLVSSTKGQQRTNTSPFFPTRLKNIKEKIIRCKQYIETKNFSSFGTLIESEALELHGIMITSHPPLLYLIPNSWALMKQIQQWRKNGLGVYFTINTGQNVHCICQKKDKKTLLEKLKKLDYVINTIVNTPAVGAHVIDNHLF